MSIFQYYSDIYLNFNYNNKKHIEIEPIKKDSYKNYLILAGNLGKPTSKNYWQLINDVSKKFTKIFLIPGEVEYEGGTKSYIDNLIKLYLSKFKLYNVYYLSESICFIENFKIIGGIKANKIILNELSEKRIPCIVITNNEPNLLNDIDKNIYEKCKYWIYGNSGNNIVIKEKLYTNQFGKDWSKPIKNFKHNIILS